MSIRGDISRESISDFLQRRLALLKGNPLYTVMALYIALGILSYRFTALKAVVMARYYNLITMYMEWHLTFPRILLVL